MAKRFIGNCPGNVRKDAKYSVVYGESGMVVRLIFRLTTGERALITTASHPELVEMVNRIKESAGSKGGAFYINEYRQVLVPVAGSSGDYFLAGEYHRNLEFEFEGTIIGPLPPKELSPGNVWSGPKVGIPYVLTADGSDIRYTLTTGPSRYIEKKLSEEVGHAETNRLTRRLATHKPRGGTIYINEAQHFFAPIERAGVWESIYLGGLDGDSWFSRPTERRS